MTFTPKNLITRKMPAIIEYSYHQGPIRLERTCSEHWYDLALRNFGDICRVGERIFVNFHYSAWDIPDFGEGGVYTVWTLFKQQNGVFRRETNVFQEHPQRYWQYYDQEDIF